jgi:hypothetical protein
VGVELVRAQHESEFEEDAGQFVDLLHCIFEIPLSPNKDVPPRNLWELGASTIFPAVGTHCVDVGIQGDAMVYQCSGVT